MANLRIQFSVSMVIAVVLAELVSFFWYSNQSPWGYRIGDRYLLTSIIADVGLVVVLKWIMDKFWSVRGWHDAATLSMWLTLLFVSLEAPHYVYGVSSFAQFTFHSLHKFCMMSVMSGSLYYFRNY